MNYIVLMQHFGDKQYFKGDVRHIDNERIASKLVKSGLVILESEYVAAAPPAPKPKKDKCTKSKKSEQESPPAKPPVEPQPILPVEPTMPILETGEIPPEDETLQ